MVFDFELGPDMADTPKKKDQDEEYPLEEAERVLGTPPEPKRSNQRPRKAD